MYRLAAAAERIQPSIAVSHASAPRKIVFPFETSVPLGNRTWRAIEPGLSFLSYYTDNGAFYYYQTANGTGICAPPHKTPCPKDFPPTPQDASGYQMTLDLLSAYWKDDVRLPIQAIQYDSWWYYKGNSSGTTLWEPMPSTLGGPASRNGNPSTWFRTASRHPTVLHSRWFQNHNEYMRGTAPGLPQHTLQNT